MSQKVAFDTRISSLCNGALKSLQKEQRVSLVSCDKFIGGWATIIAHPPMRQSDFT